MIICEDCGSRDFKTLKTYYNGDPDLKSVACEKCKRVYIIEVGKKIISKRGISCDKRLKNWLRVAKKEINWLLVVWQIKSEYLCL